MPGENVAQVVRGVTGYDYFIIAFYLLFMVAIGLVFRRMSKNTSDYFRAGGAMPWWITGTSAWIAGFSAWTFVGAAGKVFETGTLVLWVYYASVLAYLLVYLYTCVRFRRMRVITWAEAIRLRYGAFTEQFYTWLKVPLALFMAGVGLNAIGVFMSSVFGLPMNEVLVVLGIVVTVVAVVGGAWAVLASDFVQMMLVMTITISTAVLVLLHPQIDGIVGLLKNVPTAHFKWSELAQPELIFLWMVTTLWMKISDQNNMEASPMYLMSRSDRDARRMVLIPLIGSLIGPLIWFVPSMAATILHPDSAGDLSLASMFSTLKKPHEAAFVSVAMDVMPQGLLGLLLCAMLGATVTSMDAGLNKAVGVFVRSFYMPLGNALAKQGDGKWGRLMLGDEGHHEKRLLHVGKFSTLGFGVLIIGFALVINAFRTSNLFDFSNQLAATLVMPLALPLVLGLFYKRTPHWSAWSTALVGFVFSLILGLPSVLEGMENVFWGHVFDGDNRTYFKLFTTTFGSVGLGAIWFFFTSLFYEKGSQEHKNRVETFFANLRTPVDKQGAAVEESQTSVYGLLGTLCIVYGVFVLALMAIPNSFRGRMCFLFCGGVIAGMGFVLFSISKKRKNLVTGAVTEEVEKPTLEEEEAALSD